MNNLHKDTSPHRSFKLNFDGLTNNNNSNNTEALTKLLAVPFSGTNPYEDQEGTPDKLFDDNHCDQSQSFEVNFYKVNWDDESR